MNISKLQLSDEATVTMTQIYRVLSRFKLNRSEIKAYILLARTGPQKAQKIAESIRVDRTEIYKVLRTLEGYGLITKTLDRPRKFKAKAFEMVLEGLINEKRKRIIQLEEQKSRILKVWRSLPQLSNEEEVSEGIQVLEGKRQIINKVDEMLGGSQGSLLLVLHDAELILFYNSMFFEDASKVQKRKGLEMKLLTSIGAVSDYVFDKIDAPFDYAFMKRPFEPSFILKDDEELVIIMKEGEKGPMAMQTNYPAMISAFKALFGFVWAESLEHAG
jgi:sugar-specific transcriptional regulator TrmB